LAYSEIPHATIEVRAIAAVAIVDQESRWRSIPDRPRTGICAPQVNLSDRTQLRFAKTETHRLRGTLLLSVNEKTAAEESLRHALAIARRQTARLFELRATTSLARLWRDQGKRNEAGALLTPIYGWLTEGFDTPVLQDAKALLDQLA
jgi:hypothetical protein